MIRHQLLSSTSIFAFPAAFANANDNAQALSDALTLVSSDEMLKRSPESAAMLPYWDQVDCIVDGINSMRLAGKTYLPQFVDETQKEYDLRLSLTKMTNVYRDILETLSSKPFEEEISLITSETETDPPEAIEEFAEDVDGSGNNMTVFAATTFFNGINSALDWIFVDFPVVDRTVIRTVADVRAARIRPYWSHVLARNVLEVKSEIINSDETLVYMRILEPGNPDHVRVFERKPNGVVTWELYRKNPDRIAPNGKTQFERIDGGIVTIGIIPLVPFITGRRDGRTFRVFPALQDAADLQIDLYQQESGLKYAKTLTAYPMLAANGIAPQMEADGKSPKRLATGPGVVLYSKPDVSGKVGSWQFIEISATSLTFLAADIKETILQLRELGRLPLTAQSGNLTVITTAVAAGKSRSAVAQWALLLKDALENALVITARWMQIEYDPQVNVYNEFDKFTDGGKDVEALNSARERRDISRKTYLGELKRRKILSPEFDMEQEEALLLAEVPSDADLEAEDDNDNPTEPKP